MNEPNQLESLKEENCKLKFDLAIQEKINEMCNSLNIFGCRIENNKSRITTLEVDVSELKKDIKEIKKTQNEINITINDFINKHRHSLLVWFVGCIISISGLYVTITHSQKKNIDSLKDDIIKILIKKQIDNNHEN